MTPEDIANAQRCDKCSDEGLNPTDVMVLITALVIFFGVVAIWSGEL